MSPSTDPEHETLDAETDAMVAAAAERLVTTELVQRTVRAAQNQAQVDRIGAVLWRASLAVVGIFLVILLLILAWTTLVPRP